MFPKPARFSETVGQPRLRRVLTSAVASGRLLSPVLISGPSGWGKSTFARLYAAAALCESPDGGDSCGACGSCEQMLSGSHPDFVEVDLRSSGPDAVRSAADGMAIAPMRGKVRVFLFEGAESQPAASRMPGLLDRASPAAVVILTAAVPSKTPGEVVSRCVHLTLVPYGRADLVENLGRLASAAGVRVPTDVLERLVAASDPDLGVASTVRMLEEAVLAGGPRGPLPSPSDLVDAVLSGDPDSALREAARLLESASPAELDRLVADELARRALAAAREGGASPKRLACVLARWERSGAGRSLRAAVSAVAETSAAARSDTRREER